MEPTLANLKKARQRLLDTEKAFYEKMLSLPKREGFKNAAELIEALQLAEARKSGKSVAAVQVPPAEPAAAGKKARKARVFITDEIRKKVISMTKEGKTLDAVAAAVGISTSTAQSIKEKANLVERRGKQKNPKKK